MNKANPTQIPKCELRIGVKLSKYDFKSIGIKDSKLLPEFGSALQEFNVNKLRDFNIPEYYLIPRAELLERLLNQEFYKKFSTCSLFYMFYNMTMDMCQFRAAKELILRGWKYLKQGRVWVGVAGDLTEPEKGSAVAVSISKIDAAKWVRFDCKEWCVAVTDAPDRKMLLTCLDD